VSTNPGKNIHPRSVSPEIAFVANLRLGIQAALAKRNLSQADFAALLKVSPGRVSQILSGPASNLQARTIARIADALGVRATVEFMDDLDQDHAREATVSPATGHRRSA
jgi:transcriptional regulator with XRE-family HTH domain